MTLRRELGITGAVGLGLGSILGTGVFVALAIAAGEAGRALPLVVVVAALVAAFNGLSSAQLAAVHPVAGGSYAYGRRFLGPSAGFLAGVTFLAAKSASAATAALGVAGYLTLVTGLPAAWRTPLALTITLALTVLVQRGVRRSSALNLVLVALTLTALGAFVVAGLPAAVRGAGLASAPAPASLPDLAFAAALVFVAFTGYGRVATLGEEVRDPRRTIPRAVIATLLATTVVYVTVAWVGVRAAGPEAMAAATTGAAAPLSSIAAGLGAPAVATLVAVGAVSAMAGVLLNLLLGLSRVAFAMARDGEAPRALARLDPSGTTPSAAVWATGGTIALLALSGDVRATWSFSAVTVLLYYAITNLAALQVREGRFVPRAVSLAGLAGCLGLAAFVGAGAWWAAAGLLGSAFALRALVSRRR